MSVAMDRLRPLDARGRRQARALADLYADFELERVLTSPYVRCRQSVAPLARALGLPVEERIELAEGVNEPDLWSLVAQLRGAAAVLCTHGDVLGLLLGEQPEKGSTWVVEAGSGASLTRGAYLPPPA